MNVNYKIATAVLSVVCVNEVVANYRNSVKFRKLSKQLNDHQELVRLYATKLNDNNIRPDDFDMIVMNYLDK